VGRSPDYQQGDIVAHDEWRTPDFHDLGIHPGRQALGHRLRDRLGVAEHGFENDK
jgi:hypothetical protein